MSIGTDLVLVHLGSRLDRLCTIGELHAQNRCRKRPNQCNAQTYRDLAWCESVRPSWTSLQRPEGLLPVVGGRRYGRDHRSLRVPAKRLLGAPRARVCQMHRFAFLAFKRIGIAINAVQPKALPRATAKPIAAEHRNVLALAGTNACTNVLLGMHAGADLEERGELGLAVRHNRAFLTLGEHRDDLAEVEQRQVDVRSFLCT